MNKSKVAGLGIGREHDDADRVAGCLPGAPFRRVSPR
jgi:hypothetical protein